VTTLIARPALAKLLTLKKKTWANKHQPGVIKGINLNYNAAISSRYAAKLEALVAQMTSQTQRKILALFKSDAAQIHFTRDASVAMDKDVSAQARIVMNELSRRFQQLFNSKAKPLAEDMLKQSDKASASAVHASLKKLSGGLSLKTKFFTKPMQTIMTASIAENVSLIKSIPQKYFEQVTGSVMRSITSGNGLQDLVPALEKYDGMTQKRARNIALDQTRKAYSNLNYERMDKVGVKQFQWIHSGGGAHPRPLHVEMDGKIYPMDDLPVIDEDTGEKGLPAQLPNCRCTMAPVIQFAGETT
jgi:SPP1 gp7 family putative phage head morphogenesis protein